MFQKKGVESAALAVHSEGKQKVTAGSKSAAFCVKSIKPIWSAEIYKGILVGWLAEGSIVLCPMRDCINSDAKMNSYYCDASVSVRQPTHMSGNG